MSRFRGHRGIVGRGDLLAVLKSGDAQTLQTFREILEMEARPAEAARSVGDDQQNQPSATPASADFATMGHLAKASQRPFWRCAFELRRQLEKPSRHYATWHGWAVESLAAADLQRPLEVWSVLESRLRRLLDQQQTMAIDVERLVNRVARLEPVQRLPRRLRRQWGRGLSVIRDESLRLVPLDGDQRDVISRLQHVLPNGELQHVKGADPAVLWYDAMDHSELQGEAAEFRQPDHRETLLVLGDLGAFDPSGTVASAWLRWARRMTADGHRLLALVPCAEHRIPQILRDIFSIRTWQPAHVYVNDPDERAELLHRLAVVASPAIRLEPGLLRDLRLQVLMSADASLELDYWNSAWMQFQHPRAGTPHRAMAIEKLLPEFECLSEPERQQVLSCIRRWRQTRQNCPEIWFEELLSLSRSTQALLEECDCEQALSLLADFLLHTESQTRHGKLVRSWLQSALPRYPSSAYMDEHSGPLLQQLYAKLIGDQRRPVEPEHLPLREPRTFVICQEGDHLLVQPIGNNTTNPHPRIITFESRTYAASVEFGCASDESRLDQLPGSYAVADYEYLRLRGELHEVLLEPFAMPAWAQAVGYDEYGVWADLAIESSQTPNRRQRLRWIPAGEFWMGSPADEAGRDQDEVRHRVHITTGFWMFDTPCPQWLWMCVMGNQRSYFRDPDRPVERVSWKDCIQFLKKLNAMTGNRAGIRLPKEAEWEYACRAGTETAVYSGGLTLLGRHHGPELDQIAWYGGNSGVGYDLEKAYDGSGWSQKHYEFRACGSRRVKSKQCNSWGLYDMLGNVYEWCFDWYGEYDLSAVLDPGGAPNGAARVVRGGSWASSARNVRAARRRGYEPGRVDSLLGFRPLIPACIKRDRQQPNSHQTSVHST